MHFCCFACFPRVLSVKEDTGHKRLRLRLRGKTVGTKDPDSAWELGLHLFLVQYISPVDGSRCPSEPTCSSYSAQAFRKHGFVMGWLMTVDRLIHESDEDKVSPVVIRDGKGKIIDPVENNDFWWYTENKAVEDR